MRRTSKSLKKAGKEAIPPRTPFKVRAKAVGLRPGLSYENIEKLLELTEGPYHK